MALEERCKNAFPSVGATCTLPQGLPEVAFKRREALEMIKGDLSQWLSRILKTDIPPEKFLDTLDTGVLLCKLARLIQAASKTSKNRRVEIPIRDVKCNEKAAKEPFVARDNVSNFISWCRELGVEEAVIFESDGLVLHRDEKRVILCLLDVAGFAEKVGISPPQLVRMEREIEMLETAAPPMPKKKPPNESEKTLKDKVMVKLKACACEPPGTLHIHTYNNGKLVLKGGKIKGDKTLYARLLSDRVMVRVGGGWDTLDHFLLEHDPCRIKKFETDGDFHGKVAVGQPVPHHVIHH